LGRAKTVPLLEPIKRKIDSKRYTIKEDVFNLLSSQEKIKKRI